MTHTIKSSFFTVFVPFFTCLGYRLERAAGEAEVESAEFFQTFLRNPPHVKKGTKRVKKRHAEQGGGKAAGSLSLKVFH
ncbi:hypothetical protein NYE24_33110 [Paenibacillus sp. FSL H7-0350]|uniref:hypothetical protein n=1 Tax=Paenibacillus sp. FSL H7-0350 TaxID=2975345 RepID=UPI0031592C6F